MLRSSAATLTASGMGAAWTATPRFPAPEGLAAHSGRGRHLRKTGTRRLLGLEFPQLLEEVTAHVMNCAVWRMLFEEPAEGRIGGAGVH